MADKTGQKEHKERYSGIPEDVHVHAKAARAEMRESVAALFPPKFIEHRKAARKEMLLAAQALINHAIQHLEAKE